MMSCALRFALVLCIVAATFTSSAARRGQSRTHSYPPQRGLSGHSAKGFSYPGSSGLSGSNSHPSRALIPHQPQKSPSYPHSPGLSGHGAGGHNVPSSQPSYNSPGRMHYTPVHGVPPASYPVYHGPAPAYIHNVQSSGSKFSTLITGLAFYNLGRLSAGHHGTSSDSSKKRDENGERCSLRIEQGSNVERVKIPCYIVSTLIDANNIGKAVNTTTSTSAVVSSTMTNSTNATVTSAPFIANITTVEPNTTTPNVTVTNNATLSSGAANSNVTMTNNATLSNNTAAANSTLLANSTTPPTHNATETPSPTTTVANATKSVEAVDALQAKGDPLKLDNSARCYVERQTKTSSSKKIVDCGLLQKYALQSKENKVHTHRPSAANRLICPFSVLIACVSYLVIV